MPSIEQIKTAFSLVKFKSELAEIASELLEILIHTHRAIGKAVERATQNIPAIGLLVTAIGHLAAITKAGKVKTAEARVNLGVKVTTGLISLGIAIAALTMPHLSIPLVVAGSAVNLVYSAFSFNKTRRRAKTLEKQLKNMSQGSPEYQTVSNELDHLHHQIHEQKHQLTHKIINVVVSTIIVAAGLAIVLNPVTLIPAATIIGLVTAGQLLYHYRSKISNGFKQLGASITRLFKKSQPVKTVKPASIETNTTTQGWDQARAEKTEHVEKTNSIAATADFLAHENATLAHIAAAKSDKIQNAFASRHPLQSTPEHDAVRDFLKQETSTLEQIVNHHPEKSTPSPAAKKKQQQDDDEAGGDGDKDGGSGETETNETLHPHPHF